MDLFIFSTVSEENQKQLEDLLKTFLRKAKIEVFQTLDNLSQRLRLPTQPKSIVVLAPGSQRELRDILSIIDLLHDLRVIVIAPDHEVETITIAHQLRPRYLTYLNDDFGDLAAVLGKMVTGHLSNGESSPSLPQR